MEEVRSQLRYSSGHGLPSPLTVRDRELSKASDETATFSQTATTFSCIKQHNYHVSDTCTLMKRATIPPGSNAHDDDRKSESLCECASVEEKIVGEKGSTTADNESFELVHLCVFANEEVVEIRRRDRCCKAVLPATLSRGDRQGPRESGNDQTLPSLNTPASSYTVRWCLLQRAETPHQRPLKQTCRRV